MNKKIEFSETEIAWIIHQLTEVYFWAEGVRKVMRLLTSRIKENEQDRVPKLSPHKTLVHIK